MSGWQCIKRNVCIGPSQEESDKISVSECECEIQMLDSAQDDYRVCHEQVAINAPHIIAI